MLRQLELFGFKSFADRTVFEFSAGITGVVGPNGSGKSNVVDSIKWILGDQSAKSLRGKEMTDVIFNGSTSRTGSQFAEATLVFDNRSRFLPVDQDEVSVGRRLWQSGDSEYLINRTAARLKDVRDLFVGTGAGAAAYCIIEQGRVDQILQSNAANRRSIFEEAAGISRFKSRRTDALRRLERVEQNLVRLTDIVDEVESQVSNVRTQAERASRYREVSTELEQLWVGMAADDYRRENVLKVVLEQQLSGISGELEVLRQQQQNAEEQLAMADGALSEVDDALRESERERAELRSRLSSLETTLRHQAARDVELNSDVQRLQRQQLLMNNRVSEAIGEQHHLVHLLEHEKTTFEKRRQTLLSGDDQVAGLQAAVQTSRRNIDHGRQQLLEHVRLNSEKASAVGGLLAEMHAAQRQLAEAENRSDGLRRQVEVLEQEIPECEQTLRLAEYQLQTVEHAADLLLQSRQTLISEQSESQQSLGDLRELRSGLIARRTVLEDLEDRQEGFGIGVREILRRADESASEPWSLICGTIADLLDVDMDNAALLEVALSGRAQLLVVRRMAPFVDYINSGRCRIAGRVGFISLEEADSAHLPGAVSDSDTPGGRSGFGKSSAHAHLMEPSDDDFSASWWGLPDSIERRGRETGSRFDELTSESSSQAFAADLRVTWIDSREQSPVVRSVFSRRNGAQQSLFGRPGVVGRADALARSPRQLPWLACDLLADTWVVDSLDTALRLNRETAGDCRFVTLQGELLENDGTLFAGTVRSESAVLSRKSELRRLRNELHRVEHEIAQRELRLRQLSESIQSADGELNSSRQEIRTRADAVRHADSVLAEHQRVHSDLQQKALHVQEQQSELMESLTVLQGRIDEAKISHSGGEAILHQMHLAMQEIEQELSARQQELESLEKERTSASMELTRSEERLLSLQEAIDRVSEDLSQREQQRSEAERRLQVSLDRRRDLLISQLNTRAEMFELSVRDDHLQDSIRSRAESRSILRQHKNEANRSETRIRDYCRQRETIFHELQLQVRGIDHQLKTAAERIRDEFQIEVQAAVDAGYSAIAVWRKRGKLNSNSDEENDSDADLPVRSSAGNAAAMEALGVPVFDAECEKILKDGNQYPEIRTEIERRVERLRRQLRKIGHVSSESLDNLNELEVRFGRLHSQLKDLEAARDTLRDIVRRINVESRRMFLESFESIRGHFRELFRRLFGGGEADLVLEDPEDALECAIDVVARPPGKELRSISLLSGGEKTMTAVALLLAIFRSRPSPFCILDEVDAALDDANIGRFVGVLRDFQQSTQFIMITHRKPTMAVTDVLYGVTMEESGISRRLSLRFEDVDERGNFNKAVQRVSRAA
jgi:chromosome segregation protein